VHPGHMLRALIAKKKKSQDSVVSVVAGLQAERMTVVGFPAWAEKFSCL